MPKNSIFNTKSAKETAAATEDTDYDYSVTLHNLALKTHSVGGQEQTDIIATIHTPTGMASKRMVVPGTITTSKLAALLSSVSKW